MTFFDFFVSKQNVYVEMAHPCLYIFWMGYLYNFDEYINFERICGQYFSIQMRHGVISCSNV